MTTNPFEEVPLSDLPTVQVGYPPSLPHDVALCSTAEELHAVISHMGITPVEYDYISDLPAFRKEVSEWKQRIQTEGYGFKLRMRAIAEAYLPDITSMLRDPSVAPSVRTDLFKYVTKCAELEPKKETTDSDGGSKIIVNIAPYAIAPPALDITDK